MSIRGETRRQQATDIEVVAVKPAALVAGVAVERIEDGRRIIRIPASTLIQTQGEPEPSRGRTIHHSVRLRLNVNVVVTLAG